MTETQYKLAHGVMSPHPTLSHSGARELNKGREDFQEYSAGAL